MNLTATATLAPTTRIITVTSRTTNYELLGDDTSNYGLTQATIISEPYFDSQTPVNVTGLVGKHCIDMMGIIFQFSATCAVMCTSLTFATLNHLTQSHIFYFCPHNSIRFLHAQANLLIWVVVLEIWETKQCRGYAIVTYTSWRSAVIHTRATRDFKRPITKRTTSGRCKSNGHKSEMAEVIWLFFLSTLLCNESDWIFSLFSRLPQFPHNGSLRMSNLDSACP